jgi:hypothetical protein
MKQVNLFGQEFAPNQERNKSIHLKLKHLFMSQKTQSRILWN